MCWGDASQAGVPQHARSRAPTTVHMVHGPNIGCCLLTVPGAQQHSDTTSSSAPAVGDVGLGAQVGLDGGGRQRAGQVQRPRLVRVLLERHHLQEVLQCETPAVRPKGKGKGSATIGPLHRGAPTSSAGRSMSQLKQISGARHSAADRRIPPPPHLVVADQLQVEVAVGRPVLQLQHGAGAGAVLRRQLLPAPCLRALGRSVKKVNARLSESLTCMPVLQPYRDVLSECLMSEQAGGSGSCTGTAGGTWSL